MENELQVADLCIGQGEYQIKVLSVFQSVEDGYCGFEFKENIITFPSFCLNEMIAIFQEMQKKAESGPTLEELAARWDEMGSEA